MQTTLTEHAPTPDPQLHANDREYTVTGDHPIDPDPTVLTTTAESWALWWIWHRDATVTGENGRELTDDELWDRLGEGR